MTFRLGILFVIIIGFITGCGGPPSQPTVGEVQLVTVQDGESAISEGKFEEAADIFAQLHNQSPNDATITYYLGYCKDRLGELESAMSLYDKAIAQDANLTNARINRGLLLLDMDKAEQALAEFLEVEKAEPDAADVQYNIALAYKKAGKIDEAKNRFEKCISMTPDDPDPIIGLGDIEAEQNNHAAALEFYQRAQTTGMGSTVAVIKQAKVLIETNKNKKATTTLLGLKETDADTDTLATAGLMLSKINKTKEAIELYRYAATLNSDSLQINMLLGNALARQKNFKEAATYFDKVIQIAPDTPQAQTAQKSLAACNAQLQKNN